MRTLPNALSQKLDQGVTTLAQAWRLTRSDGLVVALTQHDRDLSFDGTIFEAAASLLSGDHERELGLAPDRAALSGALDAQAISETDLKLGRWNGATIEAFWVDWSNPADFIAMWRGQIGGATWRGNGFELDVVGQEAALNGEIGRVYARTCDASLGDGRCKVDLTVAGRTLSAIIASIPSDRSFSMATPIGKSTSHFVGGQMKLSTGPATGWASAIVSVVASGAGWVIGLAQPFPVAPLVGDTLSLVMSCDKSFATCKERFGNGLNFRGQPHLPGDDVAFGGPAITGNNGGKR
jgi:uncharacterized phage protein (TIGR02218 family)